MLYKNLTPKNLSEVRKKISPDAFKYSIAIPVFWCVFDFCFYAFSLCCIYLVHNVLAKLLFGFIAGIAVSCLFILAHDTAHGSLFKNKWVAEIIGTLFMLPSFNIYRLWVFGHNKVHHGFTSFTKIDWIWEPLSVEAYINLTQLEKLLYRIERSLYGCGLHYVYKIWLPKMILFMPDHLQKSESKPIIFNKIMVAFFFMLFSCCAYFLGGFANLFAMVILPFIIFSYIISVVIYLNHTHESLPFFDSRAEWNHTIGALYCTTSINSNWLINFLSHNILIHIPHHVDIRIPFYRLKLALNGIKAHYSDYIHEYKLTFTGLRKTFSNCKLYDYENKKWHPFNHTYKLKELK